MIFKASSNPNPSVSLWFSTPQARGLTTRLLHRHPPADNCFTMWGFFQRCSSKKAISNPWCSCNCREDGSSASLCAKPFVLLGPGPHQGGEHRGVYTLNRCHRAIVHCCKNMAQDKMGVINQREIQRKPRHLPSKWQTLTLSQFPAGMTYFSNNVEINPGLPALLLFIR